MSTLLEIKTAVANYLDLENGVSDLTVNSQDLFLVAANQVRKTAELNHDFEFSRKLLTLTVNGATGGDLGAAQDSAGNVSEIKTLLEVGLLDEFGNLRPVDWTTVSESLERYREVSSGYIPRYPTDGQARGLVGGPSRFTFSGTSVHLWPRATESDGTNFALQLEAYTFASDWSTSNYSVAVTGGTGVLGVNATYYPYGSYNGMPLFISLANAGTPTAIYFLWHNGSAWIINQLPGTAGSNYHSLASLLESPAGSYTGHGTFTGTAVTAGAAVSDLWTTHGAQYLTWATIVQLNHLFKKFVFRQEGNLPPPEKLRDEGLSSFVSWDNFKYEQFRRHGR